MSPVSIFFAVVLLVLVAIRFIPKNPVAAARRIPMTPLEKAGMVVAVVSIVAGYIGERFGFGPHSWLTKDQWLQLMMGGICLACIIRLIRRFTGRQAMVVSGRDNVFFDAIIAVGAMVLAVVPISAILH